MANLRKKKKHYFILELIVVMIFAPILIIYGNNLFQTYPIYKSIICFSIILFVIAVAFDIAGIKWQRFLLGMSVLIVIVSSLYFYFFAPKIDAKAYNDSDNQTLVEALAARVKTVNGTSSGGDGNDIPIPSVEFEFDHNMRDVSAELALMDYSDMSEQADVLEQVYALFDSLVEDYPDYVSKVDAAEIADLSYPDYANGVSSSNIYGDTPAYKTYLYKFICENTNAGNDASGKLPKKKLLIVSGVHGNEIAAPFNTYLFAKQLCDGFLSDPNFFKLRSTFDIYIMPCVNGYGMYHVQRGNANGVNLNRNFPVEGWTVSGEDTKDSADSCDYTGASAGSEFETQLVMAITDYLTPDIAIDHHNYSRRDWQFYTTLCDDEWLPLAYQALVDCSVAFKTHLPSYFGDDYDLIVHETGSAPGSVSGSESGTTNRWWYENGIPFESTIEISECINYVNGEYSGEKNDDFGADAFSVAEYTFRNLILHYCQWTLENT